MIQCLNDISETGHAQMVARTLLLIDDRSRPALSTTSLWKCASFDALSSVRKWAGRASVTADPLPQMVLSVVVMMFAQRVRSSYTCLLETPLKQQCCS
jgi:hypothetical protein